MNMGHSSSSASSTNRGIVVGMAAALTLLASGLTEEVQAHSGYLEVRDGKAVMVDGHPDDGDDRGYPEFRLVQAQSYDTAGKVMSTDVEYKDERSWIKLDRKTALVTGHFNNGFWSNSPTQGWLRKPGSEVPDASTSMYSHKYSKLYLKELKDYGRVLGDPLEIIPLSDPSKAKAGDTLRVRVTLFGEPLVGVEIKEDLHAGDKTGKAKTDKDGIASVKVPKRPFALMEVTRGVGLSNDPHVATLYLAATLGYSPVGGR